MATELAKRLRGGISRIHLIDVQCSDGTNYFWSSHEGKFLSRLTGAAQQYKPWVKEPPSIKLTRSLQADGGEFKIQNLSGNTVDREVAALFKAGEFEGAYIVYRPWLVPFDAAPFEFHGFVTEQNIGLEDVTLRVLQLFQPNELSVCDPRQTRDCHWRFNSAQCGYRRGQLFLPKTTANIFSANSIGASGLALVPNLFKGELVAIVNGTGVLQERFILSHSGTTLTVTSNWTTVPDGTSQFIVTGPGTAKVGQTGANIFSATTIGNTALARTVNGDVDGAVYIWDGTGSGQKRAIVSNTATTFTVSPAWATVPDATSAFYVVYRSCAKDRASCVTRGVVERFSGVIFLQPQITAINGPTGVGTGGSGQRGGGGGGGGSDGGSNGDGGRRTSRL
jgi:hypothetical protein